MNHPKPPAASAVTDFQYVLVNSFVVLSVVVRVSINQNALEVVREYLAFSAVTSEKKWSTSSLKLENIL